MVGQRTISRFAVFSFLAIGFIVLGVAASSLLLSASRTTYYDQVRENLSTIAGLSASQVDPNQVQSLNNPKQTDSADFQALTRQLEQTIVANSKLQHLSILRAIGPQYNYIADASSQGQSGSKSELLDPADQIPADMTRAVTERAIVTSIEPNTDRWGTWYSAYAPIYNESGEVVAILQADSSAAEIDSIPRALKSQFDLTIIILIATCIGMAWLASGPVTTGYRKLAQSARNPLIRTYAEIFLLVIILAIALDHGNSTIRQSKLDVALWNSLNTKSTISELRAIKAKFETGTKFTNTEIQKLRANLLQSGQGQAFDIVSRINSEIGESKVSLAPLENRIQLLEAVSKKQIDHVRQLQTSQAGSSSRSLVAFLLLSAAALILVRYASSQNLKISQTVVTNNSVQAELSSLVENIPVGLFMLEKSEITFANQEFASQIRSEDGSAGLGSLEVAIHPEDRADAVAAIRAAANAAKPFNVQYRISSPGHPTLHVETRGVPVYDNDGVCRKMLAFTIDFTSAVEAKSALEEAYGEVEHKNKLLANALTELENNLESVVRALVKAVEAKDPYTAGHSERVMQYSIWLGEAVGLGPYELRILQLGTLVHDVGKIGIPDAILTKPDRLTDEEFAIIKKHPEYGVNIISDIDMFRECIPIIRGHHERLDGRGYPDQLQGDEISILVRIAGIADIFDAMTSTRAYRTGMPIEKVLDIMHGLAENGEIDPLLFSTFCQVIHEKGMITQNMEQEPWKAA